MSVSEAPGAALSARRWWCEPGEPVVWALWTRGTAFRVDGCDEYGLPKPGLGRRFGSAVGKVGDAVAAGALTGIFGGGDDGGSGTRKTGAGVDGARARAGVPSSRAGADGSAGGPFGGECAVGVDT